MGIPKSFYYEVEPILGIDEWLKIGKPSNTWFSILRNEDLNKLDRHTPAMLIALIEQSLTQYGKYELRKPDFFSVFDDEVFEIETNYLIYKGFGNINGNDIPVVTVCTEAKILDG